MRPRIQQELALLTPVYPGVKHAELNGEDWFLLPSYRLPPSWRVHGTPVETADLCFKLGPAYPTGEPYAFLLPTGINFNGQAPANAGPATGVPFPGDWMQFSWSPQAGWTPAAQAGDGSNLLAWARSFSQRLKEGV
jgi:hypothetical protein